MKVLKALLGSGTGVSMMRLMSLLCCIASIAIAFIGLSKPLPIDYSGLTLLCSAFLGAAFGGKVLQKNIETKIKP